MCGGHYEITKFYLTYQQFRLGLTYYYYEKDDLKGYRENIFDFKDPQKVECEDVAKTGHKL